ncbi:Mo-dependent nitrogenase C-terminal domain-containing protein [Geitlerinema sp. PCC 9228]|jgi:tellurite resistance protein|uniref:Mo-dependent nitrogenase C-terminal domain-containing protein n=1 Tax=Geitlerinema sp. PCC 9228 TaxID=111611 RepID=UPI0008F9C894|nr:Mo-dependent nitrogenase C-terminal domain-containing protein [Geitlerinema sp. PCC 9228]
MTGAVQSLETREEISTWMRGLLKVAWVDGHFDEQEQELIASVTQQEVDPNTNYQSQENIQPEEIGAVLGKNPNVAENFMRTAVMVALADGVYSPSEDDILHQFCDALGLRVQALESLRETLEDPQSQQPDRDSQSQELSQARPHLLRPVRDWLEGLEIHDPKVARFLCKMIPAQCPFEREIKLFGHKIVYIPPLCKLNPLYDQLVNLRFRALSYLADECGEDVSKYC